MSNTSIVQAPSSLATPFHAGELAVQQRVGVREQVAASGRAGIRDHMPEQHRDFFRALPFFFIGALDAGGQPWATVLAGDPAFISSPDARTLRIDGGMLAGDPLEGQLQAGGHIGGLGLQPMTRRRNRVNGVITSADGGVLRIAVSQSFGNCPQYISNRQHSAAPEGGAPRKVQVVRGTALTARDRELIAGADTFFIASANVGADGEDAPAGMAAAAAPADMAVIGAASGAIAGALNGAANMANAARGADVSHRGGRPGFVRVDDEHTLTSPEFVGNFFFNTVGNLLRHPRAGLLFIDFDSGDMLHLAVEAEIIWDGPRVQAFAGAERLLRFHIREVVRNVAALPLRWTPPVAAAQVARTGNWDEADRVLAASGLANDWRTFTVDDVRDESDTVTSFYLQPADGMGVAAHVPGQFISVRVGVTGAHGKLTQLVRSYTLSDAPDGRRYRISVKRDGVVSSWMHAQLRRGGQVEVMGPAGDFIFEEGSRRPVVMLSAGIGITPMIAMLNGLLVNGSRTRHAHPIYFIHGARNRREQAFAAHLLAKAEGHRNLSVHVRYSAAENSSAFDSDVANWEASPGRVDMALLKALLPFDDYDFYLCGPADFMQQLYDGLRGLNVADERIRFEAFGPASVRRTGAAAAVATSVAPVTVTFKRSGVSATWDGHGSLLDLAEAQGLPAESGCRSGLCGSCAVGLRTGEVAYTRECGARPAAGQVLMCSTVPRAGVGSITLDL